MARSRSPSTRSGPAASRPSRSTSDSWCRTRPRSSRYQSRQVGRRRVRPHPAANGRYQRPTHQRRQGLRTRTRRPRTRPHGHGQDPRVRFCIGFQGVRDQQRTVVGSIRAINRPGISTIPGLAVSFIRCRPQRKPSAIATSPPRPSPEPPSRGGGRRAPAGRLWCSCPARGARQSGRRSSSR